MYAALAEVLLKDVMDVQKLIASPPKLHSIDGNLTSDWKLDDQTLLFLESRRVPGIRTIETGAGLSTLIFASKKVEHTCVVPDQDLVERIRRYCDEAGFSSAHVNFVVGRSEYVLPSLNQQTFELALIDGQHGFPAPILDWFYIADLLKTGGLMIIDDLQIWTCEVLMEFMLSEDDWICIRRMPRSVAFEKRGNNAQHKEWVDQRFVMQRSKGAAFYE